jgi:exosortase/archaeosortase
MKRIAAVRSRYLAAYVVFADAVLCFLAVPFELYCERLIAQHTSNIPFLLAVLFANAALVAMMFAAAAAAGELLRRGVTRPVSWLRRLAAAPVPSKRSAR